MRIQRYYLFWLYSSFAFGLSLEASNQFTINANINQIEFSWELSSESETIESGYFVDGQPWVVVPEQGLFLLEANPNRESRTLLDPVQDREENDIAADINITVINPPVGDYYEDLTSGTPRLAQPDPNYPWGLAAFGWDSRGAIRYGLGRRYGADLGWDGVTPVQLNSGDVVTTPKSFIEMRSPETNRIHSTVLKAVAVLTVLEEAPPSDAFRPGVVRSDDRRTQPEFIRLSDIRADIEEYLIDLPSTNLFGEAITVGGSAPVPDDFQGSRLASLMPGPAIMNISYNDGEGVHGYVNNSGATYSADVSRLMGDLALGSFANWITQEQREACRIRFVQRTIDAYESLLAGLILSHDGGMMTAYGMRIALAGAMLNHEGMISMDVSVNGLEPQYFLGDYAQVAYIGDPDNPGQDAPAVDSDRFLPWDSREIIMNIDHVPVDFVGDGFVWIKEDFVWPVYRSAREVQNLKFKIMVGPGSGDTIYRVSQIEQYGMQNPALGDGNPNISGGRLLVAPEWADGQPGDGSYLYFFPATSEEANQWVFKASGNVRPNRFISYDREFISLSPMSDYASVNLGAYLSMTIALYALEAEGGYSAGMDKWMIGMSQIPGWGEVTFNSDRSRFAGDPVVRSGMMERSVLGGLWKEVVLDRIGATFAYAGDGLAGLPVPSASALAPEIEVIEPDPEPDPVDVPENLLVNWGPSGSIVTGFFNMNRNSLQLDLSNPANPAIGGPQGYYNGGDPEDVSPVFYATAYNSTDGNSRYQIPNSLDPNPLVFDFSNGTDDSTDREIAGAVFWTIDDGFLNTGTYSAESLRVSIAGNVNASTARGEIRIIISTVNDGFFISEDIGIVHDANAGAVEDYTVSSWFEYDPTVNITQIGDPADFAINEVSGIGYMYNLVSGFTNASMRMTSFRAEYYSTGDPDPDPDPDPGQATQWGGWTITGSGHVDTGDFLGWVYPQGDWVYVFDFAKWVYLPEDDLASGGVWGFFPN